MASARATYGVVLSIILCTEQQGQRQGKNRQTDAFVNINLSYNRQEHNMQEKLFNQVKQVFVS